MISTSSRAHIEVCPQRTLSSHIFDFSQRPGGSHANSRGRSTLVIRNTGTDVSSLVKYKLRDNQYCFPACPPGSMEVSRPQPSNYRVVAKARASLTSGYWCALLSRENSDNSRTTNLESPLPTKRPEAWMMIPVVCIPRSFARSLRRTT